MHDADRRAASAQALAQQADQAEGLRRAMAARPVLLARRLAAQAGTAQKTTPANAAPNTTSPEHLP